MRIAPGRNFYLSLSLSLNGENVAAQASFPKIQKNNVMVFQRKCRRCKCPGVSVVSRKRQNKINVAQVSSAQMSWYLNLRWFKLMFKLPIFCPPGEIPLHRSSTHDILAPWLSLVNGTQSEVTSSFPAGTVQKFSYLNVLNLYSKSYQKLKYFWNTHFLNLRIQILYYQILFSKPSISEKSQKLGAKSRKENSMKIFICNFWDSGKIVAKKRKFENLK